MKLKLVNKKEETVNILTLEFEKPTKFSYKPGQYLYLTLPKLNYPDQRGATRHFTLSSSPTENLLTVTTIIRPESGYKQTLLRIATGTELEVDGPYGEFFLDKVTNTPQVFIAGGIGITPFRSIIKYQFDQKLKTPITLIYSAKTPEQLIFKKEFAVWAKNNPHLNIIYTVTQTETSPGWKGNIGRISEASLSQYDLTKSEVWVCGPPAMVSDVERIVKPKALRVYSEKFTGY